MKPARDIIAVEFMRRGATHNGAMKATDEILDNLGAEGWRIVKGDPAPRPDDSKRRALLAQAAGWRRAAAKESSNEVAARFESLAIAREREAAILSR